MDSGKQFSACKTMQNLRGIEKVEEHALWRLLMLRCFHWDFSKLEEEYHGMGARTRKLLCFVSSLTLALTTIGVACPPCFSSWRFTWREAAQSILTWYTWCMRC